MMTYALSSNYAANTIPFIPQTNHQSVARTMRVRGVYMRARDACTCEDRAALVGVIAVHAGALAHSRTPSLAAINVSA